MKDILLITPPFTQLNTPYPATAYLKGFLNTKTISTFQVDLGLEVILDIFSKEGLKKIFQISSTKNLEFDSNISRIFSLQVDYIKTIDAVISFLQGKNMLLAQQICTRHFLPEASRFDSIDDLDWAFGTLGIQDKAKHLATLYLEDISDFIVACLDSDFGFSRYAERLGRSANSFQELYDRLQENPTFIDQISSEILNEKIKRLQPKLVCFSVPFPGNLYSAFRCAQYIKANFSTIKTAMGGGFPNTELRNLSDTRVFEFFDYITLDDGELPIELLFTKIQNPNSDELKRTFLLKNNEVVYINNTTKPDYKQTEVGTPDYSDLQLDKYISVIEMVNPMHSLWSNGRWNKLTMAHGCYWGKCTFCDTSLDYIKIYEPIHAKLIVDRIEELVAQTGETGFHFVDEAAPPALMREVALEIIKRNLTITWWTNIRFEKSFSYDLCKLLKMSGCVAVSGGLEVASDRLLTLIKKGVSVAQVAQVCQNFTESGIMVHAYLMYGYPTQTVQETIDSLEMVRQLFECGIVNSAFWHQFALTAHSPIGINPDDFGIVPSNTTTERLFAYNDIQFKDKTGINHNKFSFGLKKSLYNYMHGICFEYNLQDWFDFKVPKTTIPKNYIFEALQSITKYEIKEQSKIVWIGGKPQVENFVKAKKGKSQNMTKLSFHNRQYLYEISLEESKAIWLIALLEKISTNEIPITIKAIKIDYENQWENFELFWFSKSMQTLREFDLLVL